MTNDKRGVLLVGHGTRDAQGQAEFRQVAAMLRKQLSASPVTDCFLELAEPDITVGVDALVEAGVREIIAAPLLLFAAGHAKRDIPQAIAEAAGRHDGVRWSMADALGDHPAVLRLAAQRFAEARRFSEIRRGTSEREPATLVVVSRGSSDPEAIASVHAFVDSHCAQLDGVTARQVGFLAAATPTLEETLEWACAQGPANIVVQPHLLFHGQLVQDILAKVTAMEAQPSAAGKKWHIADHLGPAEGIVTALLTRIQEVTPR